VQLQPFLNFTEEVWDIEPFHPSVVEEVAGTEVNRLLARFLVLPEQVVEDGAVLFVDALHFVDVLGHLLHPLQRLWTHTKTPQINDFITLFSIQIWKNLRALEKVKSRYLKRDLGVGKQNKNTYVYKFTDENLLASDLKEHLNLPDTDNFTYFIT
jgi:hypothetical protein